MREVCVVHRHSSLVIEQLNDSLKKVFIYMFVCHACMRLVCVLCVVCCLCVRILVSLADLQERRSSLVMTLSSGEICVACVGYV